MNWTLQIDPLFKAVGLKSTGQVSMNENSYDFDPKSPKDSWLYLAFLGLKELKGRGFEAQSFATIGTGSGIDSIGVYEFFILKKFTKLMFILIYRKLQTLMRKP